MCLHKPKGVASLPKSMGIVPMHKSMGVAPVNKAIGIAPVYKSKGATFPDTSTGHCSLHTVYGQFVRLLSFLHFFLDAFQGADTPPPTGRSDGSPRAATAPSSGWLQCVFNGCRHTSQDGQFHRPPRRPDHSMSHSAARHTQTGRPVQLAPSVVVCPQPHAVSLCTTTSATSLATRFLVSIDTHVANTRRTTVNPLPAN